MGRLQDILKYSTLCILVQGVHCGGEQGSPDRGLDGSTGTVPPSVLQPGSSPECPSGYARDPSASTMILCRQGVDEVVKVGKKGSAFWIDRYEASVWEHEDGTGNQYLIPGGMDAPASFPKNGQATAPLYAVSKSAVMPSFATWFQASEACRASGKQLPTGQEWLAAARGTFDPGKSPGVNGVCLTDATSPRQTGMGSKCVSDWGAEDMVGNIAEHTASWLSSGQNAAPASPWPAGDPAYGEYSGDGTWNIESKVYPLTYNTGIAPALPAVAIRGGSFQDGVRAGIFALNANYSPSSWHYENGFRCVIPR